MHQLLQLNSSVFSDLGESSQLANALVASLKTKYPGATVIKRDLAADPIPHLDGTTVMATFTPPGQRNAEQVARVRFSDNLIDELKSSDVVVIGLPMYNLDVPSTLKSYFDQISRTDVTFRFTESGPEGLLGNRKVVVIATRGGTYSGTPFDTQTQYVRNFLGFLGVRDIRFVYAEGLNGGDESKAAGLQAAKSELERIAESA